MPAVLVHGVPDTHHLWEGVRSHLSRDDIITPSLPGFGSPTPDAWTATKEEYLAWLIAEVEKAGEPVDIVGHDWGALLTERLAMVRPDLVRTWAAGGGAIHEDYVWHDMARSWQTPGVGETVMQAMSGPALAAGLTAGGVPAEHAETSTARIDDTMKDCILKLYRSAVNVGKEWGPDTDKMPPGGLLIWGANDPYMQIEFAEKMAERAKAQLLTLDCGHWWPLEKPAEVAAALEKHWA
ncbi:MAG TPA: alpha/beta fold hydrolase [Dehalococcoidia bacterium]|nr:alpha/beta fold hydrolase [Dehalococcoidia bacterium]